MQGKFLNIDSLFPNIRDNHLIILVELYYIKKYGSGYKTNKAIADLIGCKYSTMTGILSQLYQEGLIELETQELLDGSTCRFWRITTNAYNIIDNAIKESFI